MAQDVTGSLENPQQIEAVVTGPDGANRLYICTGAAWTYLQGGETESRDTFVFKIGPTLTRRQVIRAIATASLAQFQTWGTPTTNYSSQWRIASVDADWDDESDSIQVRVEIAAGGAPGVYTYVGKIGYQVTILAEM
jgi:hypothetical protein